MGKQETEVKFVRDFKRFCPKFNEEDDDDGSQLVLPSHIMDVFFNLELPMTKEIAEEMVFDADVDGNGGVSYDDLICTISTIGLTEVYSAMENDQKGLRVVHEFKRVETFNAHQAKHSLHQSPARNRQVEVDIACASVDAPSSSPTQNPTSVTPNQDFYLSASGNVESTPNRVSVTRKNKGSLSAGLLDRSSTGLLDSVH